MTRSTHGSGTREVRFFIEQLPDKVKEQLYERPLLVIPVVALTAEPVDTVILVGPVEEVAETEESEKAIQQRFSRRGHVAKRIVAEADRWFVLMVSLEKIGQAHYLLRQNGERTPRCELALSFDTKAEAEGAAKYYRGRVGPWAMYARQIPIVPRKRRPTKKPVKTPYGVIMIREGENLLFEGDDGNT